MIFVIVSKNFPPFLPHLTLFSTDSSILIRVQNLSSDHVLVSIKRPNRAFEHPHSHKPSACNVQKFQCGSVPGISSWRTEILCPGRIVWRLPHPFHFYVFTINPFPYDKILHQTTLKAICRRQIKCNKNFNFCL